MTQIRADRSAPLAELTTLRLGGPARAILRCPDAAALIATLTDLDDRGESVLLVGGGSNLVIADDGFDGVAVVLDGARIEFGADGQRPYVTADAGVDWDALVAATVDAGFGGLECLSGIPGSAGATPVQNVGAYGVEVADVLRAVQIFDRTTRDVSWVSPHALDLAYRTSNLKYRSDRVVVSVSYWLEAGGRSRPIRYRELATSLGVAADETAPAADVRDRVLDLRRGKGMVLDPTDHDTWSAGSFFTNPVVASDRIGDVLARIATVLGADVAVPTYPAPGGTKLSAGWLIERAGFGRGYPDADAPVRLSTKHTLALTNRGSARTADLLTLAREVRAGVQERFDISLHPEPVLVNCEL